MASIFDDHGFKSSPRRPVAKTQPAPIKLEVIRKPQMEPQALIKNEIKHIRHGKAVYTRHEIITLTTWSFIFLGICFFLFYTQDVWIFSYYKTNAFNSYMYMRSAGDTVYCGRLVQVGAISESEKNRLDSRVRAQAFNPALYPSMSAAQADARRVSDFMETPAQYASGHYEKLSSYTRFRLGFFKVLHLQPPQHWTTLDPSPNEFKIFQEEKKAKDPGDPFNNI